MRLRWMSDRAFARSRASPSSDLILWISRGSRASKRGLGRLGLSLWASSLAALSDGNRTSSLSENMSVSVSNREGHSRADEVGDESGVYGTRGHARVSRSRTVQMILVNAPVALVTLSAKGSEPWRPGDQQRVKFL